MMQDDAIRALEDRGFYPDRPDVVRHVQTHISHVFLAGSFVYKLKKAVRFPFLDFSTPALREKFCREEVRLNRRLCPGVYLDVVPITRGADGGLRLGGEGEVVEHVVRMRRLPAERMLKALLAAGSVTHDMMDALARTMAAFHAEVPTGPRIAAYADPSALRRRWDDEARAVATFIGPLLHAEDHAILADFGPTFVDRHEAVLRARQERGRIREGHGDLHAEHVCFIDEPGEAPSGLPPLPPGTYVFDCIEFSETFRCNDVTSEIAFLAMDLESLDHAALAARFVASYVEAAADPELPTLLPFYACYRAIVRGKVEALEGGQSEVDAGERKAAARRAERHFSLAVQKAWEAGGPFVVACCGLAGSGKTTLATELAAATGGTLLSSDVIRRRPEEAASLAPVDAGRYTPAAREAVYAKLVAAADDTLGRGRIVIADATFLRSADRALLTAAAKARGCPLVFVVCRAEESAVRTRLEARAMTSSLSDARWDTYLAQRDRREPFAAHESYFVVDTGGPFDRARASAVARLWEWRRSHP